MPRQLLTCSATRSIDIEREQIEHLAFFEEDFDVIEGITRLEISENPFN